jgi:hypothetical protein
MTRRLVLTNEAARHPFRQRLPRPVIDEARKSLGDLQLFAMTFTAGFLAFYGMLS